MLLKKIPSLIILFNFYIYIILVLKINNSIISALKIMNLNILLLNFLKCSIAEYASKPCSECAWCKNCPVHVFPTSQHWRLCWRGCPNIFWQFCIVANIRKKNCQQKPLQGIIKKILLLSRKMAMLVVEGMKSFTMDSP